MNIALIGYGKMGKAIEAIALQRGHTIAVTVDIETQENFTTEYFSNVDVAIEFTAPHSAIPNIHRCADMGIPVVVGTTGWYNQFEEVKNYINQKNTALLYATNFSLGVNIFFKVNEVLAKLMNAAEGYNVSIEEIHHTQKLDAPSGTAITTAERILANYPRKKNWVADTNDDNTAFADDELVISSLRQDPAPGTHTVEYRSGVDRITLMHEAFSRQGFAEGAVLAAEFLKGKQGIYTMNDLLNY